MSEIDADRKIGDRVVFHDIGVRWTGEITKIEWDETFPSGWIATVILDGHGIGVIGRLEGFQPEPQDSAWHHCSPGLLDSGVDCGETPRRPCQCPFVGSHDHLVVTP